MTTPTRQPRSRPQSPARDDAGRAGSRRRSDRALISLAEAVTAGLTPQEILDLVVAAAATLVAEATVHLWLVTDDGEALRLAAASGARPGKKGVAFPQVMRIDEGLVGAIAQSREPMIITSVRGDRRLANAAWARDQGLVSFAGVPLARAERLLGVLCLFTWHRYRFTRYEMVLLRSFANHAAVALENATLFEASASRLRRLETLREIEGEILQQRDPEALLGLISRRATELLQGDSATVYLLEEAAGVLRAHASYNVGDWVREMVIPLGKGVVGVVALRREGMVVNDYPRSPHAIPPFHDLDWALLAQPLLQGGTLQGVIIVRREAVERPFSQADLVQLGDFAVQASIALENARLLRLVSARAERVKAAADVGQLLASTLDADRILDLIAEKCREILRAEAFALFRLGPDGQLRYARGFGFDEAFMRQHTLALGEGVVGKAVKERRSIQTPDVLADPAIMLSAAARGRIERQGSQAIVGVPILIRQELWGALAVYHGAGFRIPAEEVEFLETLANHAAAALENARLFAQTRRRQETAETLAVITQTLTGSLDVSTVLSRVADGIRRLLASDGGSIGLVDPDGAIRVTLGVGLGTALHRGVVIRPGQGAGGRVLQSGEPFWTTDYLHDPRITSDFAVTARAVGLVGVLAAPVRLGDEVVGVLWASYGRPAEITEDDVALATDLARVVAIAVQNARLYEEARRREAEARALFEVSRLINATLDPEQVLDLIVEKVLDLMHVPACGIFRLDARETLRYIRGIGLSTAFIEALTVPLGQGTSGRAVAERAPVWTADILADPAIPLNQETRALVEQEGYRAVLSVPIEIKGAPFGCLTTYWWEPHVLTPGETATISSLATLAAVALENARLYDETRAHVRRLESLNQINRAVSASLRLDEVLAQVAHAAGALFGVPLVVFWVADEERRTLTRRVSHGDPGFLSRVPQRVPYGQGGVGWVAEHRTPLLDASVESDPRILGRELALSVGITSFSGMPLLLGDRLLGVLVIGGGREAPLSTGDQALLQTLMGQAAIAIENARLYEAAQRHEAEAVALAEASRRFGATLRREAVLESLEEGARRVLGEPWSVLVIDRETAEAPAAPLAAPESAAGAGPGAAESARIRAGRALAADVAATGRPLFLRRVTDLPDGHPGRAALERSGIRSLLLVPVVTGGVARAILIGSIEDDTGQFTDGDLRLAEAIADRAARALDNARLFEELARAYQELKTAQEQLVQTEKLRALGEMASGVAHDFNNALAVILGRVQLILRRVEDPTIRRWLEIVERAALDASQTVRRIQEFTRIRRDQPTETVDLNQVVRDAVEMTQTRWRDETQSRGLEVRLVTDFSPVPALEGHPAELREAFTNLILNAVDALPRGGTITITTRPAGDGVEVCVADTGVGMSDEVRRRIFEPFFSTKGTQGTGLGLAMVYGIVSRHGGQLSVESREGAGSTFTLRLRVGRGVGTARTAPLAPVSDAAARVLVIDDEEEVRDALADMLRVNNHEVVVARDGAEGLERFRAGAFDLVMTDLGMPGMSGWQVAQAVKAARPDVPVVLVTGWGVELPAGQLHAHGVDRVMTKPFKLQDVLEVVASFQRGAAGGTPPVSQEGL